MNGSIFHTERLHIGGQAHMEIALDTGPDDVKSKDEDFEVLCPVSAYYALDQEYGNSGIKCTLLEIAYIQNTLIHIHDKETAESNGGAKPQRGGAGGMMHCKSLVFSNFDIDDSIDIEA